MRGIFTGKAIYHMFHIVTNVSGKHSSFLGPLVFVLPGQLTAEGERHRKPLVMSIIGVCVGWAAFFAVGAVGG